MLRSTSPGTRGTPAVAGRSNPTAAPTSPRHALPGSVEPYCGSPNSSSSAGNIERRIISTGVFSNPPKRAIARASARGSNNSNSFCATLTLGENSGEAGGGGGGAARRGGGGNPAAEARRASAKYEALSVQSRRTGAPARKWDSFKIRGQPLTGAAPESAPESARKECHNPKAPARINPLPQSNIHSPPVCVLRPALA